MFGENRQQTTCTCNATSRTVGTGVPTEKGSYTATLSSSENDPLMLYMKYTASRNSSRFTEKATVNKLDSFKCCWRSLSMIANCLEQTA
jgi:hypothetical protein